MLSKYKLENTFNADDFGLFHQCLPTKKYHPSGEKRSGGKNSKSWMTGIAAASGTGKKLPMFVIDNSTAPQYFRNIKQLPCHYRTQKKNWITGDLLE